MQLLRAASALAIVTLGASGFAFQSSPFTDPVTYPNTLFITPNGRANHCGPMVRQMLGAQPSPPSGPFGAGQFVQVGIETEIQYTNHTEGSFNDCVFTIFTASPVGAMPLPPGVSISTLPAALENQLLAIGATDAKVPGVIAAFEWAKAMNVPLTFQMQTVGPQSGLCPALDPGPNYRSLDRWFENGGPAPALPGGLKGNFTWDVSDVCAPNDNPTVFQASDTGATCPTAHSFACLSIADPDVSEQVFGNGKRLLYQKYLKRNLQDAITQILQLASDFYPGQIAAIAIDPEVHYPSLENESLGSTGPGIGRPFIDGYEPAAIRQFQLYERERYGDMRPDQDTNGDGRSFCGPNGDFTADYPSSGNAAHPHTTLPTTWFAIDPPRNFPTTDDPTNSASARTKYWHEWINFRVAAMDEFIEKLVAWAIEAGVPPERIFTHQTGAGSSHKKFRSNVIGADLTFNPQWPTAGTYVREWLDDWIQMEVSGGRLGSSIYQPGGVDGSPGDNGFFLFDNFAQRDEGWGAPEYNPFVRNPTGQSPAQCPPCYASQAQLDAALQKTFTSGAHVLWPHAWGTPTHPAFDETTASWSHAQTVDGTWTRHNMSVVGGIDLGLLQDDGYIESPAIDLPANKHHIVAIKELIHDLSGAVTTAGPLVVEFRKQSDPTNWWPANVDGLLRTETSATQWFVIDLATAPQWNPSDRIVGLRVHPVFAVNDHCYVEKIVFARSNLFTERLQALAVQHDAAGRPQPPAPFAVTLSGVNPPKYDLGVAIATLVPNHLRVYGTDPVAGTPPGPPLLFNDFGTTGNFEYGLVTVGGVQKRGIKQGAASFLGQRKSGRYRRIRLPDVADLYLSFAIGLEGGATTGEDGVRFRVVLRDDQRTLASHPGTSLRALYDRTWKEHAWSATQYVDLTPWRNQVVDLVFETHGIADPNADAAAWSEPRLEHLTPLVTPPLTSIAGEDGWVLESGENSEVGGSIGSASNLRVGDWTGNKQQKTILSFDTQSLANKTIVEATLSLRCTSNTVSPATALGRVVLEIAPAAGFGPLPALANGDFQAASAATMEPVDVTLAASTWISIELDPRMLEFINKAGKTQVRLSFLFEDDNDGTSDNVEFRSGSSGEFPPSLQVKYL